MAVFSLSVQKPKLRICAQNEFSRTQDYHVMELEYNDFRPRSNVKKYLTYVLILCILVSIILMTSLFPYYLLKTPQVLKHLFKIYLTIILVPIAFLIFLAIVPTFFSQDLPIYATGYVHGDFSV